MDPVIQHSQGNAYPMVCDPVVRVTLQLPYWLLNSLGSSRYIQNLLHLIFRNWQQISFTGHLVIWVSTPMNWLNKGQKFTIQTPILLKLNAIPSYTGLEEKAREKNCITVYLFGLTKFTLILIHYVCTIYDFNNE